MVHRTGDLVKIRDYGEYRLVGASEETGIVQFMIGDDIITTPVSEIIHNYHEAARQRAGTEAFLTADEYEAIALADPEFKESLMRALQQSADGDVESLGSFAQYADD